jgi:hypothetical protein
MQQTINISAENIISLIKEKKIKIGDYTIKPNFSHLYFISLLSEDIKNVTDITGNKS